MEPSLQPKAITDRTTATNGWIGQGGICRGHFIHLPLRRKVGGFLGQASVSKSLLQFLSLLLVTVSLSSCKGFFVDPTLSSITVTPATPSIPVASTKQMTATGTYNDGSTKKITGSVSWSSDDSAVATVSDGGLVSGIAPGTVSVTATSATISGSTSATITVANLRSIAVSPTNASISSNQTKQFTAIGTLDDGTTVDITDAVTWSSSDTSVATISSSGLATAQGKGTTYIVATSGSITSNTATLIVN